MEATVSVAIPEFNSFGDKKIKFKPGESKESTFKSILNSLNKSDSKNWRSIEFEFEDETILVCLHWLTETGFDFEQSHQIQ